MVFNDTPHFAKALELTVEHYYTIDSEYGINFVREYDRMRSHLQTFPEACPLSSTPPIRKFIFKQFPYRVRYIYDHELNMITLLSLQHMSTDNVL